MLELAVIAVRLLQYLGAMVLFGSSLFFVYAAPVVWPRRLLAGAAGLLALSSLLAIGAQASLFAGSLSAGFTVEALGAVVSSMDLGKAALVRAIAAALALVVLLAPDGRLIRPTVIGLAAVATASLAWMGHGAASENSLQLSADVIHALSAAAWLGALAGFIGLLGQRTELAMLHAALRRFSQVGVPLVASLVLTGLVNSWFLVGLDHIGALATTSYGRLLLAKLALFTGMLVLAARNRNRHTSALEADLAAASSNPANLASLRRSIFSEVALGLGVLGAVAWLGTLGPPASFGRGG
jgi:copper resistance protein D